MRYLGIILLMLLFWTCSGIDNSSDEPKDPVNISAPATEVRIVKAVVKPFEYLISASGKIASVAEVRMQFRRPGIIAKKYVRNGQQVKQGQLLAVLVNETQDLSLSKAKLLLEEKRLAFTDQMIYAGGQDSTRYKNIRDNIRITSGLAGAEIAYEEAKIEYDNSFVKAQISGVISGVELDAGSPVKQSDLFCFIHDPLNLLVQTEVLEADALLLSNGTQAVIRPISSTGEVYKGEVENINPRVDDKTGLVKVTLIISERSRAFPGMNVQATLHLPFSKNIIIPKEAVVIRSGKAVVFTSSNGLAKWNYVIVGRENGIDVEVLQGLKEGDEVIVTNNLQLAHDAAITIN